jgi:hypothetical protein
MRRFSSAASKLSPNRSTLGLFGYREHSLPEAVPVPALNSRRKDALLRETTAAS